VDHSGWTEWTPAPQRRTACLFDPGGRVFVTDWKPPNRSPQRTELLAAAAFWGGCRLTSAHHIRELTTYDEHQLDRAASRKKPNSVSGMTDISVIPDIDFRLS
jgi:hypothetical protein